MYLLYDAGYAIFNILLRLFFRFRVIGLDNIPRSGPVIIASNHASYLDPIILGAGTNRRVHFVAKEQLFDRPWKKFILQTAWKAMPIRREQLDKAALRVILDRLKAGNVVGVFPEGTRSVDDKLLPGKAGIGMIVAMAKAPVVPVYIKGSYLTMGKDHKKLRPTPITLVFGRPMEFQADRTKSGHDRYQEVSDRIMAEIETLKASVS